MSMVYRFEAMAALLRQGRLVAVPSWLFCGGAIAWLVIATLGCEGVAAGAYAAAAVVVLAALAQAWLALRVGFDAGLLAALAPHAGVEDTAALVDATLFELGLIARPAQPRDWPARWRGARALLRWQAACLALQLPAFAVMLVLGEPPACWNA